LQQEQQRQGSHQCFNFAPHSAQNLFVSGFWARQEGQTVVGEPVLLLFLRADTSRRISASRSFEDSILSILEHHRASALISASDLLIILFRELAALVFEIEILNVAENDIFFR